MNKILVNYKFTKFYMDGSCKYSKTLTEEFDDNVLFPNMISDLLKKHNIKSSDIQVENIKTLTWGKLLGEKLSSYVEGDDYHYKWLKYNLKDINETFHLFGNVLNIIINGPGIGGLMGEDEGIKFYINPDEKDRHEFEPHVHCEYQHEKMRIRIDTLEVMKKDKEFSNPKKVKVAKNWIKENQEELLKFYNSFAIKGDSSIKFEVNI